ncbi:MAG: hypothetical protein ACT6Q9_12845 [Polaromonas sp.]|uniref:hypothetical protein n=1 Tax=Polaromonas sp. TaxID=1869339 RepID=UPI004035BF3A
MRPPPSPPGHPDDLTSFFWDGDTLRSRSVSDRILSGTVAVPAPPALLTADWAREIAQQLQLEAGDVEPLSLPRARLRWPDYKQGVQAVADWTRSLGLQEVLAGADVALMACRGARYHHDGVLYGGMAFCNLFLSEDQGLDIHFPAAGRRIPLCRGTVVIFDTGQPHAVIPRGSSGFDAAAFGAGRAGSTVFLSWELPVTDVHVTRALGIDFDTDPAMAARLDDGQLRLNGAPAEVCAASGRWTPREHSPDRPTAH